MSDKLRVLMVGAHPDDVEFRAAGLALKFLKMGAEVEFLVLCNGSKGHHILSPEETVRTRAKEMPCWPHTTNRVVCIFSAVARPISLVPQSIHGSTFTPSGNTTMDSAADVTPTYFCTLFHRITQKTPMEYVLFYRIEQACVLLASTDLPIIEVGLRCGFNDSGYFARQFKKQIGTSPSQYRKQA